MLVLVLVVVLSRDGVGAGDAVGGDLGPHGPEYRDGTGRRPVPPQGVFGCPNDQIDVAIELKLDDAFLPRAVTAAMQTTAMRATSRAYSTREAPRSERTLA